METLERRLIQEQRMRDYFIQATKDILKSEGLKAISVRNIADRAGYSYATLYNYFKDVKDLIFECVGDFQKECEDEVMARTQHLVKGKKRIAAILSACLDFFIQYPGIFELFFMEKLSDIGSPDVAASIARFPDSLCREDWAYCIGKGMVTEKQVVVLQERLRMQMTGLLLMYLNRRHPATYQEFKKTALAHIRHLLEV